MASLDRLKVNTEFTGTWKEMEVAKFKEIYQNLPEQPEENHKKSRIWSGFELGFFGINSGLLLLQLTFPVNACCWITVINLNWLS
jgi:hypothetical protein